MLGKPWHFLTGVVFLGAAAYAAAQQADLQPMPEYGLLVLHNGEVFQGDISRAGDLFYVVVSGGEIRIKAEEVEFCCRDLSEAYERKRAAVGSRDADAHVGLALWCLKHGLLGPAEGELADVALVAPDHPAIELLRIRLELAKKPLPKRAPGAATVPFATHEQLDQLVEDLPPGAFDLFAETVQPLLLDCCGAAACHGSKSESELQLMGLPPAGTSSRRITQRNLHSVMSWINRNDPMGSPLLSVPLRPHGTAEEAVFGTDETEQYRQIAEWISMLSERPAAEATEPVVLHLDVPPQAMPVEAAEPSDASNEVPPDEDLSAAESSVRYGAPLEVFVPVDPFDPEIFNRRYFGDE